MSEDRIVWTNCRTSCQHVGRKDMFCVELNRGEGDSAGAVRMDKKSGKVALKCLIQEEEHNCQPKLHKTHDNRVFFSSSCLIPIVGCSKYYF